MLFTSCSKLGTVAVFNGNALLVSGGTGNSVSATSGLQIIDTGNYEVNHDISASCLGVFANGTAGCTQPSPIVYSDGRWHVGFSQNYLTALPTAKFSGFVSMTSLTTGLFGTFGFGINFIDTAVIHSGVAAASTRYVSFAKLDNGDVLAIMYVHDNTNDRRQVYVNRYSALSNVWTGATLLSASGANVVTDRGIDYPDISGNNSLSLFCKPSIATSGNRALAAWCEDDQAVPTNSRIVWSLFNNGTWSTSGGTTPLDVADYESIAVPGISAATQRLDPPAANIANPIAIGDTISASIDVPGVVTATVTAVSSGAGSGQFNIVLDPNSGVVLACDTLRNAIAALLNVTASGTTLAALGVSFVLDPSCTNYDGSDVTAEDTWNITMYYNYGLSKLYRVTAGTPTYDVQGMSMVSASGNTITAPTTASAQPEARRSSAVAVGADEHGNFAMIRTLVSPFFRYRGVGVTTTGGLASETGDPGIFWARRLVGHVYGANTGWVQRSGATGSNQADVLFASPSPACFEDYVSPGRGYVPCSVKNPKFLVSRNGNGLALFYQKQLNEPVNNANPVRLYFSEFSFGTGFSIAGDTVDEDLYCSSVSEYNDTSVCETGVPSSTFATACTNQPEPTGTPQTPTTMTHDVGPIPAAMNDTGKALVAYHKDYLLAADTCAGQSGLFVRFYDPVNGFGDAKQIDSGAGNTLHAQVAINNSGDAAVVWEEVSGSTQKVYLRRYTAETATWSNIEWVNETYYDSFDTDTGGNAISTMPSVGINDDGEIWVVFSKEISGIRRLIARRYE